MRSRWEGMLGYFVALTKYLCSALVVLPRTQYDEVPIDLILYIPMHGFVVGNSVDNITALIIRAQKRHGPRSERSPPCRLYKSCNDFRELKETTLSAALSLIHWMNSSSSSHLPWLINIWAANAISKWVFLHHVHGISFILDHPGRSDRHWAVHVPTQDYRRSLLSDGGPGSTLLCEAIAHA